MSMNTSASPIIPGLLRQLVISVNASQAALMTNTAFVLKCVK